MASRTSGGVRDPRRRRATSRDARVSRISERGRRVTPSTGSGGGAPPPPPRPPPPRPRAGGGAPEPPPRAFPARLLALGDRAIASDLEHLDDLLQRDDPVRIEVEGRRIEGVGRGQPSEEGPHRQGGGRQGG